jgi:protease-4
VKKFFWFVVIVLVGVFLISFIGGLAVMTGGEDRLDREHANIGVIEIEGVISESLPVLEQIRDLEELKNIKALVVRVDSPGGAVGASQEIYLELRRLREKMPVVISMGNLAASGGLYSSIAGTKVFALPGTITGSMGVLMPITNFARLVDKMLVDPVPIKSGELKDAGNPLRPMDAKAKQYFQDMVNKTFKQFKEHVKTERKLKAEVAEMLSDGRVVDGLEAKEIGLVDEVGSFEDAVNFAKEAGKVSDDVKLAWLSRKPKSIWEKVIEGAMISGARVISKELLNSQFSPYFLPGVVPLQ